MHESELINILCGMQASHTLYYSIFKMVKNNKVRKKDSPPKKSQAKQSVLQPNSIQSIFVQVKLYNLMEYLHSHKKALF